MASLTYLEEMGDLSPTTANFGPSSQSVSATYLFHNPSFDNLRASIVDILGYTDTREWDGRIKRYLPARHQIYQWMFADSCSHQGVGAAFGTVVTPQGVGSPLIAGTVPLYTDYHVRVNYSARPYNSWQDKDITVANGQFYPKTDTGSGSGTSYAYAPEWLRFCEFIHTPTNSQITAQQGQMRFRASGGGGAAEPDGKNYQDAPKMWLPDSLLKVKWHQVPYRYVTSPKSYLLKFVGHVNQVAWGPHINADGTYGPYAAGSLLYLGCTPTSIYTPAIPDEGLLAFNKDNGFLRNRLCDLELNFLYTARTIGSAAGNTPDMSTVNRNWIVGGHNLLPWLTTRKFYYATSFDPANPSDQTKWFPTFNSFVFSLLFTDPDVPTSPTLDP